MDKIATSIFEVNEGGKITCYTGNYSEYAELKAAAQPSEAKKEPAPPQKEVSHKNDNPDKPRKLRFSYKEQREFETIDSDIAALEANIAACSNEMENEAAGDYVRLQELVANLERMKAELEVKTERWVYLNELHEKIEAQK